MALQFDEVVNAQQGQTRDQLAATAIAATVPTFTPPNVSSPTPSGQITNGSAINFNPAGTPDNGASLMAAAVAGSQPVNVAPPSDTPGLDGDYTKDPSYQTAQTSYDADVTDYKNSANAAPSQNDLLNEARTAQGTVQKQAKVDELQSQLNSINASFNKTLAEMENPDRWGGISEYFYLGHKAAASRLQAVLAGSKATELALAQGQYDKAEQLAQQTAELKFNDAQRKIDNKLKFIELNRDNLTRAESVAIKKMEAQAKKEQAELDKQKENVKLALTLGLNTKYINKNGEFFDTNTGKAFTTPAEFFKAAGITSFEEAYAKGLVSEISNSMLAERDQAATLRSKYWDAGINLNDSYETVVNKINTNSKIRAKELKSGSDNGLGTYNNSTEYQSDLDKAKQFLADNPTASAAEIELALKTNLPKLSDGDIKSVVATKVSPSDKFLSEDYIKKFYSEDKLAAMATKEGYGVVNFGFDKSKKDKIDLFVPDIMATVELYRQQGLSDKDIMAKLEAAYK